MLVYPAHECQLAYTVHVPTGTDPAADVARHEGQTTSTEQHVEGVQTKEPAGNAALPSLEPSQVLRLVHIAGQT